MFGLLSPKRDVDSLMRNAEAHRQGMATEKQVLLIRRDVVKQVRWRANGGV